MKNFKAGILTMTRGDSNRIVEWIKYHQKIGFGYFCLILDNCNDDTVMKIDNASIEAEVEIVHKHPVGPYYDGLSPTEVWEKRKEWLKENEEYISSSELPINDEISWRQYMHFPNEISRIQDMNKVDWLSIIDVDEFIVLKNTNLLNLLENSEKPRLRLYNFNYDTSSWNQDSSIVKDSKYRWSRRDIEEFGKGWQNRHKSIVKLSHALPLVSVHAISRGPFEFVSIDYAQLNHYKYPAMNIIDYSVYDPLTI